MELAARSQWWLLLLIVGLLSVQAQKVSKKQFDSALDFPYYFDSSDIVLITERNRFTGRGSGKLWISQNGGAEWKVATADEGHEIERVDTIHMHPYDNTIAFALTAGSEIFYTHDQGKTWTTKHLLPDMAPSSIRGREVFSFHVGDSKKIVFNTERCFLGSFCEQQAWYSNDGLVELTEIAGNTRQCMFARSKPEFKELAEEGGADRILCVVMDRLSPFPENDHLYISDDLFDTASEPALSDGRTVTGIVSLAAVKGYLLVAARAERTSELALFVSVDGKIWHQAIFGTDHKLEENGYTVLESTNYSVQVVVQGHDHATLLSSNSNGTYFEQNLEYINIGPFGYADFEKVQGFQGVIVANVVGDHEDDKSGKRAKTPKIKSKITFHDGKGKWKSLVTEDDKEVHLHSVTEARNAGRVFSSAAPGVMLGIGNSGSHLKAYDAGELYVSNDAGRSWKTTKLHGPHKYEFADEGNILLAVPDKKGKTTKKAQYSVNHGEDWKELELDDHDFIPQMVTTAEDNTSLRVLVIGRRKGDELAEDTGSVIYSIDFDEVFGETCEKGDMEEFPDVKNEDYPCIMGHHQVYRRRKRDAKCFVRAKFHGPLPENEPCTCTKDDFECDFNFIPKDGKCEPAGKISAPEGACKEKDDTFEGRSGFRLIPDNDCKRKDGEELDKNIERPCSDTKKSSPNADKITAKLNKHGNIGQPGRPPIFVYLERSGTSQGDDETVLFLDNRKNKVFISNDHGKSWAPIEEKHSSFKDEEIVTIVPHSYNSDAVFFLTASETILFSYNRCKSIHTFKVPHTWSLEDRKRVQQPLSFHPDPEYKNWIIWTGRKCDGGDCQYESRLTKDRGEDWETLLHGSNKCEFIQRESRNRDLDDQESKNLVFCQRYKDEDVEGSLELVSSSDFFETDPEPILTNIVAFETMSEFIVVAIKDGESLKVNASVYGGPFAPAHFPYGFDVDSSVAYTLLQSETHAIFIHVTTSSQQDREFGSIMKSDSNGASYVTSHPHVNRDSVGYTDFEKVKGLEGVSLINVVANADKVLASGEAKQLQTLITHNDGADWTALEAPPKDNGGRSWGCKGSDCKIHLHGYTEKRLKTARPERDYSSETAIGLMIANGNVGATLDQSTDREDITFISTDGGMNWNAARTGKHFWAFGDQGSIIILVPEDEETNTLVYTLHEGEGPWEAFTFADDKIVVEDVTTVPSDNSKNFLIWGRLGKELVTVNVDFSQIRDRQCRLDDSNIKAEDNDYYTWSPKHPGMDLDEDCLFGHQSLYHRKILDASCWNGKRIPRLHDIARNCTCRRADFECDYNYEKTKAGDCKLVTGFSEPDHSQVCRDNPDQVEYFKPTGYRRIPLDTCSDGLELERLKPVACAGHEEEFNERHRGLSGFAFFLVAICLPFGAAAGIGWWVYRRWDGKFGAIHLGENAPQGVLDIDKPWVKYPVMVLSALAAVAMAVPEMVGTAWRGVNELIGRRSGKYTSRASFARGRGDYTVVEDEDELLGDDDEDEV